MKMEKKLRDHQENYRKLKQRKKENKVQLKRRKRGNNWLISQRPKLKIILTKKMRMMEAM